MRPFIALVPIAMLALACDRQTTAPADETSLAATLSAEAVTAMSATDGGPVSLLRRLVQGVRESDNARAKALIDGGQMLQGIVLVFPNAATRISNIVRSGLDHTRASLGSRDAPRIRNVLDEIAGLLRQSAAAQDVGRLAAALDFALQADARLERLQDYLR
ncbi:MAG: hypothetical protein HY700_01770 [Gemmatimonadetes bacterium]|nr:hypothetical protein [Gemmatimonadota bacterium]